jgi:hypothetical protein
VTLLSNPAWVKNRVEEEKNISLEMEPPSKALGISSATAETGGSNYGFVMIPSSWAKCSSVQAMEEKVGEANWCCKQALKGNVFLRQEIVYKLHGSVIYIKQSLCSLPKSVHLFIKTTTCRSWQTFVCWAQWNPVLPQRQYSPLQVSIW